MTQTAIDLTTDSRAAIADALNQSVAETAVTTMLAQNFHWNVTGMAFGPLHELFQKIYEKNLSFHHNNNPTDPYFYQQMAFYLYPELAYSNSSFDLDN